MSKRSSSEKDKVYKFVHHQTDWIQTNLLGREFENEWLKIAADGKISLRCSKDRGYAWDGCSPKWNFIHLMWGTPDGKLDYRTEKPITYYSSMFHDVIYQFKSEVPISRKESDILFKIMLQDAKFMWWSVYGFAVRTFGGFYGKWFREESQTDIQVLGYSWLEE
ncbi:MAG: hypothetical protein ACPGJS_02200 [Flammeovirgaceae bacterium]